MRRVVVLRILAGAIVILGVSLALVLSEVCSPPPPSRPGHYVSQTQAATCTSRSFERVALIGGAVVVALGVLAVSAIRTGPNSA